MRTNLALLLLCCSVALASAQTIFEPITVTNITLKPGVTPTASISVSPGETLWFTNVAVYKSDGATLQAVTNLKTYAVTWFSDVTNITGTAAVSAEDKKETNYLCFGYALPTNLTTLRYQVILTDSNDAQRIFPQGAVTINPKL